MTNHGPSGPPPPGAGYGPPSVAPPAPGQSARPAVSRVDAVIVVAGVLALIVSASDYYTGQAKGALLEACRRGGIPCSTTTSAWAGFFGWFGVVLLAAAAMATGRAVLAPATAPVRTRWIAYAAASLGLVCTVVALFRVPAGDVPAGVDVGKLVDLGHGWSYWVVLVVSAAMTVLTFVRLPARAEPQPPGPSSPV